MAAARLRRLLRCLLVFLANAVIQLCLHTLVLDQERFHLVELGRVVALIDAPNQGTIALVHLRAVRCGTIACQLFHKRLHLSSGDLSLPAPLGLRCFGCIRLCLTGSQLFHRCNQHRLVIHSHLAFRFCLATLLLLGIDHHATLSTFLAFLSLWRRGSLLLRRSLWRRLLHFGFGRLACRARRFARPPLGSGLLDANRRLLW